MEIDKEITEELIKYIKDNFEDRLFKRLGLLRVSGPIIVNSNTNINDYLNQENPVSFIPKYDNNVIEIVQSLAKWKRMRLKNFNNYKYQGIYVNMNAIRPNEIVDYLHSYYVDQWDWEMLLPNQMFIQPQILFSTVINIHEIICNLWKMFDSEKENLALKIISSKELYDLYPNLTPKEREYKIVKEYKAVFISEIGYDLPDGRPHDNRAADYDNWNYNGDLLYWSDALEEPIEISSMGIRVNKEALMKQLYIKNEGYKIRYEYHNLILHDKLPFTIGGGIGQSRLCMLLLNKKHIGEVQCSVWPDEEIKLCKEKGIELL